MHWVRLRTRVIQLKVFYENESDSMKTILSEVPFTPSMSVKKEVDSERLFLRDNLLQVTVTDKNIIFDLSLEVPQEIFFMTATSQFIQPAKYVNPGSVISACTEDSIDRDALLNTIIKMNRSKTMCMIKEDRKVFRQSFVWDNYARMNVCKGIFKLYSEADIQELSRIMKRVNDGQRVQNIDLQTALSTFNGHTLFSIFSESVAVHEQLLNQIMEGEFPDEELDDETVLENNQLRRLYRTLTMPTPDFIDEKERKAALAAEEAKLSGVVED